MGQVNLNLNSEAAYAIESASSLIANVSNQYIVSASGAPPGVSGFVFDILDVEEISLQSDITDHYLETNSSVQDNIVQKPVKFTLKGYVGELKQILNLQTTDIFSQIAGLLPIGVLLPSFNIQDTAVYQEIANTAAQAQSAISAIGSISSLIPQLMGTVNFQQQAYSTLYGLWINRTLCTVQTPFGLLTNMAIEDLRPSQGGETQFVSSFSITFKQINQVGTAVVSTAANPNPSGTSTQSGNNLKSTSTAVTNPANLTPPNYPTQSQSGISSSNQSGRASDMLAPAPPTPGPSNVGLPAPELNALVPQNSPILETLPPVLPMPIAPLLP